MDSLTQIVLGAAVGEAVLGKKIGNKAMLYGGIAGTIPDLDTFAGFFTDTVTAIELHRAFTHSIIFAVVFAPVLGLLVSKIERKSIATWKNWSWLFFWGLLTHPILDSFTTWGTQLFWPLETELAFKSIFVIDPLYTLPLIIGLVLAFRQKKGSKKRRYYNNLGLLTSTGYLLLSLALKGVAFEKFEKSLQNQTISYLQIETRPSPLNIVLWNANVELENAYLIGDYSFFDERPIQFERYPKNHQLLGDLKNHPKVQRLIDISNGWYTISKKNDVLRFNDLRFGKMNPYQKNSSFVFSYELIETKNGLTVKEVEKTPENAKNLLSNLWQRIF
ncbi:MAG TPA: metal-dependent hydrolase [Flavobacteriaceae bacterium]|nr:metal-dependent hydrolase [Flavobacteriaceae bacterium]